MLVEGNNAAPYYNHFLKSLIFLDLCTTQCNVNLFLSEWDYGGLQVNLSRVLLLWISINISIKVLTVAASSHWEPYLSQHSVLGICFLCLRDFEFVTELLLQKAKSTAGADLCTKSAKQKFDFYSLKYIFISHHFKSTSKLVQKAWVSFQNMKVKVYLK